MDNKHRKLFVIRQSKGANVCLKCTKIRLAAGFHPDPLGDLMRSIRPPSRDGGLLLSSEEREGRGGKGGDLLIRGGKKGEGPTSKGDVKTFKNAEWRQRHVNH